MTNNNFINVSAVAPNLALADIKKNIETHKKLISKAAERGNNILVFPELSLTGATVGDLFLQGSFLDSAYSGLIELAKFSSNYNDLLIVVGLPLQVSGRIYNVAASLLNGEVLGFTPKYKLNDYDSYQESRYFASFNLEAEEIFTNDGHLFSYSPYSLCDKNSSRYVNISIVVGSDIDSPEVLSKVESSKSDIIINPNAETELLFSEKTRTEKITQKSADTKTATISAYAGKGESSSNYIYQGAGIISELGENLVELKETFNNDEPVFAETLISLSPIRLSQRRIKANLSSNYATYAELIFTDPKFSRLGTKRYPFVRTDDIRKLDKNNKDIKGLFDRCINLQAAGLARRIKQIHAKTMVIGVSGGLDSTVALLVCDRARQLLGLNKDSIMAVTMPGFGSSKGSKTNAELLAEALDIDLKEISIVPATTQHLEDIEHDINTHDLTYENAQARERTQILMDLSNKHNGLVVGTGDLSEMALGWCTYNGDQMSMYAVNSSLPKTTMRYLLNIAYDKYKESNPQLAKVLNDIVTAPVSPELLPPDADGNISQKTEEQIGSYTLHDFFLYHYCYRGNSIADTYALAKANFICTNYANGKEQISSTAATEETFTEAEIKATFKTFIRRLYTQQFKRKAAPDAIKITELGLSASGDFQIPSDLNISIFMDEVNDL